MVNNHGNLFSELVILVRRCYGVLHIRMNSTGVGVGDRDRTISGAGRSGCGETGGAEVGSGKKCMVDDSGREGWRKGHS